MNSFEGELSCPVAPKPKRLGYLSAAPRVSIHIGTKLSGPRAHVLGVIQAFDELGWEVHPYIVGDLFHREFISQSEQIMDRSTLFRFMADIFRLGMGLWHNFRSWSELHGKVDWVYERFAVMQSLGWMFQKRGIPWILETNGLLFHESTVERKSILLSNLARILEIRAYHRCDVLVCVAEGLKDLIIQISGISPDKVLVVPNGVDVERCNPDLYTPKRLFDGPTLGFIGGLFNWRRLDFLLAALAELKNEGVKLNFVVVGDGPMSENWKALAVKLDLCDSVRFVGHAPWDHAPAYIAGFDLGYIDFNPIEAGKMFGSPLKLFEYMAMSVPVVSSAFSDSLELIVNGENGFIFESGNMDDLKRVLRLAYQNKIHWKKMGHSARDEVLKKASWVARVQTMLVGVEQILEEQGARPVVRR